MTVRDDSSLYTGATSSSFVPKVERDLKKQAEEKKEKRELRSKSEKSDNTIALEEIQRELDDLRYIGFANSKDAKDKDVFWAMSMAKEEVFHRLTAIKLRIEQKTKDLA